MFILNNKPLPLDTAFEVRGVKYPANWLRLSTADEKESLGITEVADPVRPDDRFYFVSQNEDGTFTAVPKDLDGLKSSNVAQVKQTAGTLLAPTDWKVIRAQETGTTIDANTLATRSAIRDKSNLFEEAINNCDTVEELITVVGAITWTN